jgi:hypothetical protein
VCDLDFDFYLSRRGEERREEKRRARLEDSDLVADSIAGWPAGEVFS